MELTKQTYFYELSTLWLELSKKWKFNYSSWADVWDTLKKYVPDAEFEWIENSNWTLGLVDDFGCFAKVRVWSESLGVNSTMYLHAMDYSNNAIKRDKLTAGEINKTYQRCTVKAIAVWFGLWLYVYRGEDLPEMKDWAWVPEKTEPKKPYTKKQFEELWKAFNDGWRDLADGTYKDQRDEYDINEFILAKITKLGETYKKNQNIQDSDIDSIWKDAEAVKKQATG